MQFKFFKKVIPCILVCLHVSRNQQSRCVPFAMYLKFFGSLQEDRAKSLWEIDAETLQSAMYQCVRRCESDQRCVGIEICTIRPDLSRCRGCCEWYAIDKDGGLPRNVTDGCRYFELNKDSLESKGTKLSANTNLSAVASSTYRTSYIVFPPSNVLDGLYGNDCGDTLYSSLQEERSWLEVRWSGKITIWRIIIYNRFHGYGNRLVNLNVTYSSNGIAGICCFYSGFRSRDGDLIMCHCPPESQASEVKLQIQSPPGQQNILNLCEVEIYQQI